MAKHLKSIRLEPYQNEILRMKTSELGIGEGRYIGFLIEKDNTGRYKKPSADLYTQLLETRSMVKLSDTQVALLEALKKEYEKKNESNKKTAKNLNKFCDKYGLDEKVAKADLEKLVKLDILARVKAGETNYVWTFEGIITLPELAFKIPNNCPFVSGDIAYLLKTIFGNYLESVRFIHDSLKFSWTKAKKVFKIILGEHILFLNWIRDHAFDMTGIANPDDVIYFRKQMMIFLMSYCLILRDHDFVDADKEFRGFCNDLVKPLSNYFKKEDKI